MAKKLVKKVRSRAPQDVRSALRAFILAHKDGHGKVEARDLLIYLDAYHNYSLNLEDLEGLLQREKKSIGVEMKALHMEEDLFSTSNGERPVKLGSCFCPECGRFKNYMKECPHCGLHEMTV